MKDKIYSQPHKRINRFVFDRRVVRVFDDMIRRSVPGYADIIQMCGVLAVRYVKANTTVYDLGCSLGVVSQEMLKAIPNKAFKLIAVDSSGAMVEKAKKNLKGKYRAKLFVRCDDILNVDIENSSLVLLNFVLQFIPKRKRLFLLKKVYSGMQCGGALILSEKIKFSSKDEKETLRKLHEEFKKSKGYSALEISQKRAALEKVLLPENLLTHQKRLHKAGFKKVYVWFQCFNFISLIAIK